jgi:hypothetical protein
MRSGDSQKKKCFDAGKIGLCSFQQQFGTSATVLVRELAHRVVMKMIPCIFLQKS